MLSNLACNHTHKQIGLPPCGPLISFYHSHDYILNKTPLSPITITYCYLYIYIFFSFIFLFWPSGRVPRPARTSLVHLGKGWKNFLLNLVWLTYCFKCDLIILIIVVIFSWLYCFYEFPNGLLFFYYLFYSVHYCTKQIPKDNTKDDASIKEGIVWNAFSLIQIMLMYSAVALICT